MSHQAYVRVTLGLHMGYSWDVHNQLSTMFLPLCLPALNVPDHVYTEVGIWVNYLLIDEHDVHHLHHVLGVLTLARMLGIHLHTL